MKEFDLGTGLSITPDRLLAPQGIDGVSQILNYMENTNQRLDQIENDIGYIKDRVDAILKKL